MLVPEGVAWAAGQGRRSVAWAREQLATRLWQPPPGSLWVSGCVASDVRSLLCSFRKQGAQCTPDPAACMLQVVVQALEGHRTTLALPAALTLAQARLEVQRQAGVPATRQRLAVLEQLALGRGQRLAWALLRLLLLALALLAQCALAAARWLLGLPPPPPAAVHLQLTAQSGRQLELAVSPDTTLAELQALLQERHGEELDLRQTLALSPTRSQAGGGSGSGGVGADGGGAGGRSSAWRRLLF